MPIEKGLSQPMDSGAKVPVEKEVNMSMEEGVNLSIVKFLSLPTENRGVLPVGKSNIPQSQNDLNMPLRQVVKLLMEKGQRVAQAEVEEKLLHATLNNEPTKRRKRSWRKKSKANNSIVAIAELKDKDGTEVGAQKGMDTLNSVSPSNAPETKAKKRRNRKKSARKGAATQQVQETQGINKIPLFFYCVNFQKYNWEKQCKVAEHVSAMGITFINNEVGILKKNKAKPGDVNEAQ